MVKALIVSYIEHIANNPIDNIYDVAKKMFRGAKKESGKIAIPDILKLPPVKRELAIEIIKEMTGYTVDSANDKFKGYIRLKDVHSKQYDVPSDVLKGLQWLYQ